MAKTLTLKQKAISGPLEIVTLDEILEMPVNLRGEHFDKLELQALCKDGIFPPPVKVTVEIWSKDEITKFFLRHDLPEIKSKVNHEIHSMPM